MKYFMPLLWALCFLWISCKSGPVAGLEVENPVEIPAVSLDGKDGESPGLETAGEDEIPLAAQNPEEVPEQAELPEPEPEFAEGSSADLPEEETPELSLPELGPQDFVPESSTDEFAALPEPVFPEPAEITEPAAASLPEPPALETVPGATALDSVEDIYPEPAPELVQAPPPTTVPVDPPASTPVPQAAPPPAVPPPGRSRPVEPPPSSGITREPLPLPTASVPSLPAREPPAAPAPPPADGEIEYSRIVRVVVGQTIEIPFRGTGWVYLGELRSRPGVAYNSRRADSEGQTFIFRAAEAGTFGLKFYKQDYIRDYILNDHVRVIVSEVPERELFAPIEDQSRVILAPRWPYLPGEEPSVSESAGITPPAGDSPVEDLAGEAAASPPVTAAVQTPPATPSPEAAAVQTSPAAQPPGAAAIQMPPAATGRRPPPVRTDGWDDDSIVPVTPPRVASGNPAEGSPALSGGAASALPDGQPEDYFRRAREAFEAGQIQQALAILDQFRRQYPLGSDEAWWLYGQFLEAAGPSRDIRSALDYYRRLVREYPQSSRYNDARRRIAYLERFYFNIP